MNGRIVIAKECHFIELYIIDTQLFLILMKWRYSRFARHHIITLRRFRNIVNYFTSLCITGSFEVARRHRTHGISPTGQCLDNTALNQKIRFCDAGCYVSALFCYDTAATLGHGFKRRFHFAAIRPTSIVLAPIIFFAMRMA